MNVITDNKQLLDDEGMMPEPNQSEQKQQKGQQMVIRVTKEEANNEQVIAQIVEWLCPWYDKTNGVGRINYWQKNIPVQMMTNLLCMWLTPKGKLKVLRVLRTYHPLDRAALAYALLIYVMTGTKLKPKSELPQRHIQELYNQVTNDMGELLFADHLKSMLEKYGKKEADTSTIDAATIE